MPASIIFWAPGHGARGAQPEPYLQYQAGKEEQVVKALQNIIAQVQSVVTIRKMREAERAKREWEEEALMAAANGEQAPPIPVGVTVLHPVEDRPVEINLEEEPEEERTGPFAREGE